MSEKQNYIYANWKMNQSIEEIQFFCKSFDDTNLNCQIAIAPQLIHIHLLKSELEKNNLLSIKIGSQNSYTASKGAFTGETSPASLKELGAEFSIVGHSERREYFKEDSVVLIKKIQQAFLNNLEVVFCIGENLQDRENGQTFKVLEGQLECLKECLSEIQSTVHHTNFLVAYEPIWAIGTGKTATPQIANETHQFIHNQLKKIDIKLEHTPILYGGSVKASNAKELLDMKYISGALVGGASLKANDFMQICQIASK